MIARREEHIAPLRHEEEQVAHARVFGGEAGDQFRFGLGQIERRAIVLRQAEMNRIFAATKQNGLANMNQLFGAQPCARMIPCIESVPVISTTGKIESPAGIS